MTISGTLDSIRKNKEIWILTFLVFIAFFLRLNKNVLGMGTDSWYYLSLARNTLNGIFGNLGCNLEREYHYISLYGHLIALFSKGDGSAENLYWTGRILSAAAGALTCIPAYFMSRRFFSSASALFGAAFVSLMPQLVRSGSFVLTESTYVLFETIALYFGLKALQKKKTMPAFLAGSFWGIATLTRINALISVFLFCCLGLALTMIDPKKINFRVNLKIPVFCMLGWAVFYLPYAAYLSHARQTLTLTGKNMGEYSIRGVYIGQPPHANGTDLDQSELDAQNGRFPQSFLEYVVRFPKTFIRVTMKNLKRGHFDDTLRNYDFPPQILVFIGISFFVFLNVRPIHTGLFFLVTTVWASSFYLINGTFLIMLQRFFENVYVLLCILAGFGFYCTLKTKLFASSSFRKYFFGTAVFGSLLIIYINDVGLYRWDFSATDINKPQKTVFAPSQEIAFLSGFSGCLRYPLNPDFDQEKLLNSIQSFRPDFIECSANKIVCDFLSTQNRLTFSPLDTKGRNLYKISYP